MFEKDIERWLRKEVDRRGGLLPEVGVPGLQRRPRPDYHYPGG